MSISFPDIRIPARENSPALTGEAAALAVIVGIGFLLRFAWLDGPTLMRDEALVLTAAQQSPLFILLRALVHDAHPPYFYYLTKILLVFGHSDFATRFFPALAGSASVFFLHRFATRLLSREAALIAAGLLAGYFLHVQISRTVRPHPYIVCLTVISLTWLLGFLRDPNRRNLLKLTVLNLALLLFHFNALLIIGAQMTLVALLLPGAWHAQARRRFITFLAISAASMSVNLPMFLYRLGKFPGFNLNLSMQWTLERSIVNLDKMMALLPLEPSIPAGWLLFALGLGLLWARKRFAALFLTCAIFLPIAALILAKYGLFYEPWHISFIIPCLLAVCAHALAWLLRTRALAMAAALAIPLCAATVIFVSRHDALYSMRASIFGYEECNKKLAQALPRGVGTPYAVLFNDISELGFVNWYTRQFSSLDMTRNNLGPQDSSVDISLVANGLIYSDENNAAEVARRAEKLLADFGTQRGAEDFGCSSIHRWNYARTPGVRLDGPPAKTAFTAYAPDFLKHVWQALNVQVYLSPLAHSVFPSTFDQPGSFTARFQSSAPLPATDLALDLGFSLEGSGNTFDVACSFDGGPRQQALLTHGPAGPAQARVLLRAPAPFHTLDVIVTMTTSSLSPSFASVSDAVRFEKMELTALPSAPEEFRLDLPVAVRDLSQVEAAPEGSYRWGSGPETALRFKVARAGQIRLELGLNNPIPGQSVTILLNGKEVRRLDNMPPHPWLKNPEHLSIDMDAQAGENTVLLRYDLWNGKFPAPHHASFAPGDGRKLAMAFTRLRLLAPGLSDAALPVEQY